MPSKSGRGALMVARVIGLGYKHSIAFLAGMTAAPENLSKSLYATIMVRKGWVLFAAYGA